MKYKHYICIIENNFLKIHSSYFNQTQHKARLDGIRLCSNKGACFLPRWRGIITKQTKMHWWKLIIFYITALPNTIKVKLKHSLMYIINIWLSNFSPILPQTLTGEGEDMYNAFSQTEKRKYIGKKSNLLQINKDFFQFSLGSYIETAIIHWLELKLNNSIFYQIRNKWIQTSLMR